MKNEAKTKAIELLQKDSYSITEIARMTGINRATFYKWIKADPEFAKAVEDSNEAFIESLEEEAKHSLRKLVQGYTAEETTIISVPSKTKTDANGNPLPVIKEQKTIRKHYQPNTGAVIFALTNTDPKAWKNNRGGGLQLQVKDEDKKVQYIVSTYDDISELDKATNGDGLEGESSD